MASLVSATTANGGNIDASKIEESEAASADLSESNLEAFNTKALEVELSNATKQEGISGLIKSFVSIVTDLVKSLSTMMEKLSKIAPETAKKAKGTVKKTATKLSKSATGKANNKKQNPAIGVANPKNSTSTTPSQPVNKEASATEVPVVSAPVQAQTPVIEPPVKPKITEIDPSLGYGDDYLSVSTNKQGAPEIYTEDGYILRCEGKEQAWTLMSPDGKTTRIWGDPHVVESDGDKWDFKERSSFLFGDNKVTVETTPFGNGQTLTSKLTVYNGDSRVSISGIDQNKPVFQAIARDAELDDAMRDDGDIFILGKEENGEDQFVLLKDVSEKFDPTFAKQVGAEDSKIAAKYLSDEQVSLVGVL